MKRGKMSESLWKRTMALPQDLLLGTSTGDCIKQKVVDIGEVESYLSQGWEYVANLPNKRVIIKLSA